MNSSGLIPIQYVQYILGNSVWSRTVVSRGKLVNTTGVVAVRLLVRLCNAEHQLLSAVLTGVVNITSWGQFNFAVTASANHTLVPPNQFVTKALECSRIPGHNSLSSQLILSLSVPFSWTNCSGQNLGTSPAWWAPTGSKFSKIMSIFLTNST